MLLGDVRGSDADATADVEHLTGKIDVAQRQQLISGRKPTRVFGDADKGLQIKKRHGQRNALFLYHEGHDLLSFLQPRAVH